MKQGFSRRLRVLEDAASCAESRRRSIPVTSRRSPPSRRGDIFEAIEATRAGRGGRARLHPQAALPCHGLRGSRYRRRFEDGIRRPVDARLVTMAHARVVWQDDAVDLTADPPSVDAREGRRAYISATMVVSGPGYGRNVGSYR